jgi:hypothetical protein
MVEQMVIAEETFVFGPAPGVGNVTLDKDIDLSPDTMRAKFLFSRAVRTATGGTPFVSYDIEVYDKAARTAADLRRKATALVPDLAGVIEIMSLVAGLLYYDLDGTGKAHVRIIANGGILGSSATVVFRMEGEKMI